MRVLFCKDHGNIAEINNDTYRFVLIWFVDNVDEIYKEYKECRQLKIVSVLENKPWGIREFSIYDVNGYIIRISEAI
jgi:hypothetical protein